MRQLLIIIFMFLFVSCKEYTIEQHLERDKWNGGTFVWTKIYKGNDEVWSRKDDARYASPELVKLRKREADSIVNVYNKLGL